MKYPKQKDMGLFIGKKCRFIKSELCRIGLETTTNSGYETTTIGWKSYDYTPPKGFTEGWIVGFGFCFDGAINKPMFGAVGGTYFSPKKQIKYVRVRKTPMGQEIKVLASNIIEVF